MREYSVPESWAFAVAQNLSLKLYLLCPSLTWTILVWKFSEIDYILTGILKNNAQFCLYDILEKPKL